MTKLRLTTDFYTRPVDWENPGKGTTDHRRGDLIDATGEEADRLLTTDAAVEVTGKEPIPDEATAESDLADAQVKRAKAEHETLKHRKGVHPREVSESEGRLRSLTQAAAQAATRAGKPPKPKG